MKISDILFNSLKAVRIAHNIPVFGANLQSDHISYIFGIVSKYIIIFIIAIVRIVQ